MRTQKKELTTGSIPSANFSKPVQSMNATELSAAAESIGKAYERNPKDRAAGLNYANMLRMTGRNDQALAVMQQVAINFPTDREVLAAYGKSQAAAGQLEQALNTITRAQTPDRPDWKLKSAEGAILDQLGRSGEARQRYREALDIQPNEPTVLVQSRHVLSAEQGSEDGGNLSALGGRPTRRRQQRAPEPGARRRPAGTLPRGRTDRPSGAFTGPGRSQRQISSLDHVAAECLAEALPRKTKARTDGKPLPYRFDFTKSRKARSGPGN